MRLSHKGVKGLHYNVLFAFSKKKKQRDRSYHEEHWLLLMIQGWTNSLVSLSSADIFILKIKEEKSFF